MSANYWFGELRCPNGGNNQVTKSLSQSRVPEPSKAGFESSLLPQLERPHQSWRRRPLSTCARIDAHIHLGLRVSGQRTLVVGERRRDFFSVARRTIQYTQISTQWIPLVPSLCSLSLLIWAAFYRPHRPQNRIAVYHLRACIYWYETCIPVHLVFSCFRMCFTSLGGLDHWVRSTRHAFKRGQFILWRLTHDGWRLTIDSLKNVWKIYINFAQNFQNFQNIFKNFASPSPNDAPTLPTPTVSIHCLTCQICW